MLPKFASNRRLYVLFRILNPTLKQICVRNCTTQVEIGNITKSIKNTEHPEYVPKKYCKLQNFKYNDLFKIANTMSKYSYLSGLRGFTLRCYSYYLR